MMKQSYIHFQKDDYSFWKFLSLDETCTVETVRERVQTLTQEEKENPFVRFAWKVLQDPYYHDVYKQYRSISKLYEAGFFLDEYEEYPESLYDVNFLTTPFDKIKHHIASSPNEGKPYVVLLTTGGFSPVHIRHMEMMTLAKETMESKGYKVVGGYFSPSHDKYVSQKHNGTAAMHVEKRVYLLEHLLVDSDWLYVDKWESYYNRYSINFTDVITRLEDYLNHHIPTKQGIRVCYVFGGDNAGFMQTFFQKGYAVCVNRTGYNECFEEMKNMFSQEERLAFAEPKEDRDISSSSIRKGDLSLLDERIRNLYQELKEEQVTTKQDVYAIRNDSEEAAYATGITLLKHKKETFSKGFQNILSDTFENHITLQELFLQEQHTQARELLETTYQHMPSLSLDVYVKGDTNLQVSRMFELASGQLQPLHLTHRPGYEVLEQQLQHISKGEYVLIEDDVASGNTLRKITALLPKGVSIGKKLILSDLDENQKDTTFYDIVDMRDFLFGVSQSGLVVTLPNEESVRVPYVLPYVSPISRARIPFGKELSFSLEIWKLNQQFYASLEKEYTVGDMDESFQTLMKYIGFSKETDIVDIMTYHIQKLQRVVENL